MRHTAPTPALLGLAVVLLAGCGSAAQTTTDAAPPPVRTATLQALDAPVVQAVGRLEALAELRLGFVGPGVLQRLTVDIGDRVRAGQVLALQDPTALDASARQAADTLEQARRELQRAEALVERQLVPRQRAEDARTAVELAEAALRSARYAQRYGRIVAERDGVVLRRLAEPGEVVAGGQPVLLLGTEGGWRLRVEVADRDALRLPADAAAQVRVDALPDQTFPAHIREIGGEAAAGSGALTVDLLLGAGDAPLRSGLIAHATLTLPGVARSGLPTSALLRTEGQRGEVLVVEQGLAQPRWVELGVLQGGMVEVTAGLAADAVVIVEGGAWANPGQPVRLVAAP